MHVATKAREPHVNVTQFANSRYTANAARIGRIVKVYRNESKHRMIPNPIVCFLVSILH
jgi:hypothetical protein